MTKQNSDTPQPGWPYCCNCTAYVDPDGIVEGKHTGHLITPEPPSGSKADMLEMLQQIGLRALALAAPRRKQ